FLELLPPIDCAALPLPSSSFPTRRSSDLLITISTTPVIAGDSFEMDAVGALRLSPLRRGLAIDSTVERRRAPTASISKESPAIRSEERFNRNAETDLVYRLLLEKKPRIIN